MPQQTSDNKFSVAKWIVAPTLAEGATHTTIAAALTSAVSGETIFIRPGTYTENLTLKAGVNLTSFVCESPFSQVTISGKCTFSYNGSASFSGINFVTNSDNALDFTGANTSSAFFSSCRINGSNATSVLVNAANFSIIFQNCIFTTSTNNLNFTVTTVSGIDFRYCTLSAGTSANTIAAGSINFFNCRTQDFSITTSSTGLFTFYNTYCYNQSLNQTIFTTAGTSTDNFIENCELFSGSASAISVGAGTTVTISNSVVSSSNSSVITGAGTINYSGISYPSSSSNINTTSQTVNNEGPSKTIGSSNSGNTNTLTLTNSSNTASSSALHNITVGGTSAADPFTTYTVSGTTNWSQGIDNSDSDAYVLAASTALGTTNVMRASTAGEINYPLQPSFLAYLGSSDANVTGNGTSFTLGSATALTEIFDQGSDFNTNGTFTAPVTGRYLLDFRALVQGCTTATAIQLNIVTSNRTYSNNLVRAASANDLSLISTVHADMDSTDTCTFAVITSGEAGATDDVFGGAGTTIWTGVSGSLIC